jgi:hypothetical protein
MKNDFGLTKEKKIYDRYIGEYVIIYPSIGNANFAGKITKIEDGFAVLNPHQGGRCTENGLIRKMIKKDSIVNIFNINAIEPTTKESLENFCEVYNKTQNQINK